MALKSSASSRPLRAGSRGARCSPCVQRIMTIP